MKLERTVERLKSGNRELLLHAARDLGHELPHNDIAKLNEFRAATAAIYHNTADTYADGFRAALVEVTAAYQAALTNPRRSTALVPRWWRR